MARGINRLSARRVETVKQAGFYADGGGLYLRVDKAGQKRWVFVFFVAKRRFDMGLGSAAVIGLPEARALAEQARKEVAAGLDPRAERDRRAAELAKALEPEAPYTFGDAADEWYAAKLHDWEGKTTQARWKRLLEHHAASLRPRPIDAITTEDVLAVLKPIWTKLPDMAPRLRGGIEEILDAAAAKGKRDGPNPARWKGHLKHLLSAPKKLSRGHHPAMPFDQVPAFIMALRDRPSLSARLVEWNVLTVVRPAEARLAKWSEIDRKAKVWTIPAARMKERITHRVPLSDRALALLDEIAELTGPSEWLFPGFKKGRPLSNGAADKMMELMGQDAYTVHGFRSSFRDWAGERTNFPREVAEAALAHKIGDEVERAYRRGDALEKRRKLMEAWARFLATGAQPSSVVQFKQRA